MNKIKKTYHDNGKLKEEYEINEDGNKNGYFKLFHFNGEFRVEVSFTDGKQNPGTIISYHSNGIKAREVIMGENGNLNGNFSEWYDNGNLKTKGYFDNDECYKKMEFNENGILIKNKTLKLNNKTLKHAFTLWEDDKTKAEAIYGPISNWDTSKVTDITDIYCKAKSLDIDITKWRLNFKENGLFFKQNELGSFVAYHKNGNKYIEYFNAEIYEEYNYYHPILCTQLIVNKETEISIYDDSGKELKEVTIFLTPNNGDSMIIFKTKIENYTNFHEGNFTDSKYLIDHIEDNEYNNHIINLTNSNKFDLKKYPPVIISIPSQYVLRTIAKFIPDKKFVLIFRWSEISEEIIDLVLELPKEQRKIIMAYDEIWKSAKNVDENGNHLDDKIMDFPGSKTMQVYKREWVYGQDWDKYKDYDYLRLYEEEVFNSLKITEGGFDMDLDDYMYDDEACYIEPSLILDVKKYKTKLKFI